MTNPDRSTAIPKTKGVVTPLFSKDYKVYINHTDAGGIVYHANHLVFFENCRRDWFSQLGLNGYFSQTKAGNIQHFVVSQADLRYKQAILLDETVSVRVDKVELKPASVIFYQSIHRPIAVTADNHVQTDSHLLTSAKIVLAYVQNQLQAEPISHDHSDAVNRLETLTTHPAPIRPVRLPKQMRGAIEQAISEQQP